MMNMPSLFQGPIAEEYGELAITIRASECSSVETCGSQCTNEAECSRGHEQDGSCPLIPGMEQYDAFAPTVAGWSEPPAPRV